VQAAFYSILPYLPLYAQHLGVVDRSELAVVSGVMAGGAALGAALAAPVWGILADRYGQKRMLIRSLLAGSIGFVLMGIATNAWQLAALRILVGLFAGSQAAAGMFLAMVLPRSRTGFYFGVMNTSIQVGSLVGPLIGSVILLVATGFQVSFFIGAAILLADAAIIALVTVDPGRAWVPDRSTALRLIGAFRPFAWPSMRGVLLVAVIVMAAYSGSASLLAIYLQDLTRPNWLSVELAVGLAVGLGAFAAAAAMVALGDHADRADARALLVLSVAVLASTLVLQGLVTSALAFIGLRIVTGISLAGVTSSLSVLTRAAAPDGSEGRVFAAFSAAQNLGWGVGPLLAAAIAGPFGIPPLYFAAGVAAGAVALVVRTRTMWFAPQSDRASPVGNA
jgi:MFS family permease